MIHLLWWIAIATCARFHHTETHGSPDTNGKLHNTENQNDGTQSHFCVKIVVPYPYVSLVVIPCWIIVIVVRFIIGPVVVSIKSNCYAVGDDDYSTKHG